MPKKRAGAASRSKALHQALIRDVLHRYKRGALHSGRETGPVVKNRAQAIAIALSVASRGAKKAGGSPKKMAALGREAAKRTQKATGQVVYSLRREAAAPPVRAASPKRVRASVTRSARAAAPAAPVRSRSRGPRISYAGGTLSIAGKSGGRSAAAKKAWAKRRRK